MRVSTVADVKAARHGQECSESLAQRCFGSTLSKINATLFSSKHLKRAYYCQYPFIFTFYLSSTHSIEMDSSPPKNNN